MSKPNLSLAPVGLLYKACKNILKNMFRLFFIHLYSFIQSFIYSFVHSVIPFLSNTKGI